MLKDKKVTSPVLTGLKGVERDVMVAQLLASDALLKRIEQLIDKDIKDLGNITSQDFDSPSWAYKQAFELGLKKGLTMLKKYVIINS